MKQRGGDLSMLVMKYEKGTSVIIEVEMHAFANGAIRRVEIPNDRASVTLRGVPFESTPKILGLTFEFGQNDFQPQDMPSVSVGDIIRVKGKRFAVLPIGFKEIAANFTPPRDGGMWAYRLSIEDSKEEEA